jgi:agmatinase
MQIPISAYDNAVAIDQMEASYSTLLSRPVQGGTTAAYKPRTAAFALDGIEHPRLISLGGDHTIVRLGDIQSPAYITHGV